MIAETAAELDCARWLIVDSTRTMMDVVARGARATTERRVINRRNQAAATRMAVRAAERLFAAAGGMSLYSSGRLQRLFRDIHAGASHFSLSFDYAAAPYGLYRMGAELPAATF
jgi:3-hydroxy-9,10-secoandrosta-1,3,5(10)-triene-9,17-dione monooxygenase